MKTAKRIAISLAVLCAVGLAVFWNQIQDIRALAAYSAVFEPENIDVNFRTLCQQYPSISVGPSGNTATFEKDLREDVFPESYAYEGEQRLLQELLDTYHWDALVILHDGKLIHEAYDRGNTDQDHHIEFSVTKSFTSILVGIAHEAGDIPDLDAMVTEYIPELVGTGYEGVSIQQVLDMTSGIRYVEDYDDLNSDIVRTVVATLRGSQDDFTTTIVNQRPPGSYRQYASIETHVLGWVLRNATGQSYEDYFSDKLWSKLGVESDAHFLVDSAGQPVVFGGMSLRVRDLARMGQMLVNGGVSMTGDRIVSQDWITTSTTPDTEQSQPNASADVADYPLGYKNQWWIPNNRDGSDFTAIGIYGQFLYVHPERNVVIALNCAYPEYTEADRDVEMVAALQAIAKHVSPDATTAVDAAK